MVGIVFYYKYSHLNRVIRYQRLFKGYTTWYEITQALLICSHFVFLTDSELQIALVALFSEMLYRFPNVVVAQITRESVQQAIANGITAQQVLNSHSGLLFWGWLLGGRVLASKVGGWPLAGGWWALDSWGLRPVRVMTVGWSPG